MKHETTIYTFGIQLCSIQRRVGTFVLGITPRKKIYVLAASEKRAVQACMKNCRSVEAFVVETAAELDGTPVEIQQALHLNLAQVDAFAVRHLPAAPVVDHLRVEGDFWKYRKN